MSAPASVCATGKKAASLEDSGNGRILLTTENTVEIEGEDKPAVMSFAQVMLMS